MSNFFTNKIRPSFRQHPWKWSWIGLAILAILVRVLLAGQPEVIEKYYSRGIFVGIRNVLDFLIGWIPFPVVFLIFLGLAIFLFFKIKNLRKTHISFLNSLQRILFSLVAFVGAIVFLFLVMWGYNYGRLPVEVTMKIDPQPLSMNQLQIELDTTTQEVVAARQSIPNASDLAFDQSCLPQELEAEVRLAVETMLEELGYPTPGRVRGRLLRPKGILLRFSTSGVYFPWSGESNVDAGLHPIQVPFTLAHEFAHGYGFTDEGTCNFLAYLACTQSENPLFRYSGHLGYLRYLAASYRRFDRDAFKAYFKTLPLGIVADLRSIDENLDKYPDLLPQFRYVAYDTYLKAQGIKEGMKNYSRIVMLVHAFRKVN